MKAKKQKAVLAARKKDYEQMIAREPDRASQMTKPGSNKKSH